MGSFRIRRSPPCWTARLERSCHATQERAPNSEPYFLAWPKNSSWPLPCPKTHCFAHVDDKSGPGGLLPEEIPGILNICADCESMVSCPVDFYAASLS